jgi:hypothetical protein
MDPHPCESLKVQCSIGEVVQVVADDVMSGALIHSSPHRQNETCQAHQLDVAM